MKQRDAKTATSVVDLGLGIFDKHFEIPAVLIFGANALGVFVQLAGVVSLGEDVFQEDRVRDPDRPQVLHGAAEDPAADVLVALEADFANFDLGSFADDEGDAHGGGRNRPYFGAHGRELPAMLGQQFFQSNFRFLDLGGVVLTLD